MDAFLTALVTFLVVVDPPGLIPIFIALTGGLDPARQRLVALRGTAISFLVIVVFALFGERILATLSISVAAFRIAGGSLLFWIAFEMLFARRTDRKEQTASEARDDEEALDIAVFPLAVPLIAGPGALTSTLLLMERFGQRASGAALVLGAAALVVAAVAGLLLAAEQVRRILGRTVINTLTRVLGILLAALAAQSVISGVTAIYPPPGS
jgi:multiple antibiotic resistance protein